MNHPRVCYGPGAHQHAKGCRLGRPLCRWKRAQNPKRRPCGCGAYWFPHRIDSGRCGDPEKMAAFVYGPLRKSA
jgi:hypothetical protein